MTEHGKEIADVIAAGGGVVSGGSIIGIVATTGLTAIASIFTIIWLGIRIAESETGKGWRKGLRNKK